jgi:hypothetical protein
MTHRHANVTMSMRAINLLTDKASSSSRSRGHNPKRRPDLSPNNVRRASPDISQCARASYECEHVINDVTFIASLTFKRSIPHSSRDLGAVGRVESSRQCLVESQCVQYDGVVKRAHETVHLRIRKQTTRTEVKSKQSH